MTRRAAPVPAPLVTGDEDVEDFLRASASEAPGATRRGDSSDYCQYDSDSVPEEPKPAAWGWQQQKQAAARQDSGAPGYRNPAYSGARQQAPLAGARSSAGRREREEEGAGRVGARAAEAVRVRDVTRLL